MKTFTETLPQSPVTLESGENLRVATGQLQVDVTRHPHEWSVTYVHWREIPGKTTVEFGDENRQRYVLPADHSDVSIKALLADRSIVTQLSSPINLLPGARAHIYVSTPIYLEVAVGDKKLMELPSVRLSDTWFGPRTGPGELCYSDSTRARLDIENLDQPPFKTVTPIQVRNYSEKPMVLDRINVPMPLLSMYRRRADNRFITSSIDITLQANDDQTQITLGTEENHSDDELIATARKTHRKQFFSRAINLFLS